MDLIYANEKREDVGELHNYKLDLAYGKENDFDLEIYLHDHCLKPNYMIYIEGTEYGGIVDGIYPDTNKDVLIYHGRTWHGIIENKVIEPEAGEDYKLVNGEANEVIRGLITDIGLEELFEVSEKDSEIDIAEYQYRYEKAYTGICKMLASFDAKLRMKTVGGKVILSAVPYVDYSQSDEWDSSQLTFKIEKNYHPINHLICMGQGNLKDRHVIHLFTDENGGVRPYTYKENPLSDADYILDKSQQVLSGKEEIVDTYDLSNAEITENYVPLQVSPNDWSNVYGKYYKKKDDDDDYELLESWREDVYTLQMIAPYDWKVNYKDYFLKSGDTYKQVESISTTSYKAQTVRPSDWARKYAKYFTKSGTTYAAVNGTVSESYRKQSKIPNDWKKNYANYYYYYSDGITSEYRKVSGITKYKYVVQTQRPTDWNTNFTSYFKKKKISGYEAVVGTGKDKKKAPAWGAKKYFTKVSYQVAPAWKETKRYTFVQKTAAPTWKEGTYYTKNVQTVPAWAEDTYYTKTNELFIPEFEAGAVYERRIDNYEKLVEGGLEKLTESYDCDKIAIALDPDEEYDIGDVVGASENITGITVWQPITKKIVKIEGTKQEISYQIGGE